MKPDIYQTVRSLEEPIPRSGGPGKVLFQFKEQLRWYILIISLYALGSTALTIWVLLGPILNDGKRVLRTGNVKVDQFYSGLALSVLLTPAAIAIRRIAYDMALLHPFAIASKAPMRIADLDVMMDPGFLALTALMRYSFSAATIQSILLLSGAVLMPVGTLLVTTGSYAAPTTGTAVIGMPTEWQNMMTMSIEMNVDQFSSSRTPNLNGVDAFAALALDVFQGTVVKQTGVLTDTNAQLGPVSTPNLTLEEGVRYYGIVTYTWASGCEYTDEISYTENTGNYDWMFNITSPAGDAISEDAYETGFFVWNETNPSNEKPITTYYAAIGAVEQTVNMEEAAEGIDVINGSWISRVKCIPQFNWEVSNCLWRDNAMEDCVAAPGGNTTELDVSGLNALKFYFGGVPMWIYDQSIYVFGLSTIQVPLMFDPKATQNNYYRAPLLADYNRMYGLVAQSLAAITTAGYYGAAQVPTEGSAPKPVYVVRTYILAIVMAILISVPLLTIVNISQYLAHHLPLRRATFLTIANAVRGPWWDLLLWGGCVLSPEALRNDYGATPVMFGVDERNPQHVGLALDAAPIQKEHLYSGAIKEKQQ